MTTDSAGQPLAVGDRVAYRFFFPCGRCRMCLKGKTKSCPVRQANFLVSCEVWPHFQGGFGEYFYLRPNHAVFKLADDITDDMAAGVNCAFTQVYAGLDIAAVRAGQTVVIQGAGGLGVYACAVAKEMGAARVIVIDGVEERLTLARSFGATESWTCASTRRRTIASTRSRHSPTTGAATWSWSWWATPRWSTRGCA